MSRSFLPRLFGPNAKFFLAVLQGPGKPKRKKAAAKSLPASTLAWRLKAIADYVPPVGMEAAHVFAGAASEVWRTYCRNSDQELPEVLVIDDLALETGLAWLSGQIKRLREQIWTAADSKSPVLGRLLRLETYRRELQRTGAEILTKLGRDAEIELLVGTRNEYPNQVVAAVHLFADEFCRVLNSYGDGCEEMAEQQKVAYMRGALLTLQNRYKTVATQWAAYRRTPLYFLPPDEELVRETHTLLSVMVKDTATQKGERQGKPLFAAATEIQEALLRDLIDRLEALLPSLQPEGTGEGDESEE